MKNETFGARLLARRKKLKLSQAALGKLVKVAHVTISQWERDETQPAGKRLFSLSQALQCSPTWLLFGDEDKQPAEPIAPPPDLRDDQKELLKLYEALPESEQKAQL
ncbi:helix-turn-helix domain-containing protein, partial [Salmonella enterica]|nr:helix-turn-helix domain-containing protein [Salmonella enterica]